MVSRLLLVVKDPPQHSLLYIFLVGFEIQIMQKACALADCVAVLSFEFTSKHKSCYFIIERRSLTICKCSQSSQHHERPIIPIRSSTCHKITWTNFRAGSFVNMDSSVLPKTTSYLKSLKYETGEEISVVDTIDACLVGKSTTGHPSTFASEGVSKDTTGLISSISDIFM